MSALDFDWLGRVYDIDAKAEMMRCKRCRLLVFNVTRHARDVHGDDDVTMLPTSPKQGPISACLGDLAWRGMTEDQRIETGSIVGRRAPRIDNEPSAQDESDE